MNVVIETSEGTIRVELDSVHALLTVENFLRYVDDRFYDGTLFHRAIPNFMIQGGGLTAEMKTKPTRAPIKNEGSNGLSNRRGTLAMARTSAPDSATAQFFINTADNRFLNHRDETPGGYGYAVFGRVVEGMDVAEKIENVPTCTRAGHENVPVTPVVIRSIRREPLPAAQSPT